MPSAISAFASLMSPGIEDLEFRLDPCGIDPTRHFAHASGWLITAPPPNHIVLRSRVHISGLSATTCSLRMRALVSVVAGAALAGSSGSGT